MIHVLIHSQKDGFIKQDVTIVQQFHTAWLKNIQFFTEVFEHFAATVTPN